MILKEYMEEMIPATLYVFFPDYVVAILTLMQSIGLGSDPMKASTVAVALSLMHSGKGHQAKRGHDHGCQLRNPRLVRTRSSGRYCGRMN